MWRFDGAHPWFLYLLDAFCLDFLAGRQAASDLLKDWYRGASTAGTSSGIPCRCADWSGCCSRSRFTSYHRLLFRNIGTSILVLCACNAKKKKTQ